MGLTPKQQSDLHEKRLAKQLGGKRQSGSGNTKELPGDVVFGRFLMQAKRTEKASLSVKIADLEKIEQQALNRGKVPCFTLGFGRQEHVTSDQVRNWIAFPEWFIANAEWWHDGQDE